MSSGPHKIATLASAQIGDTLMATSLYQALRRRHPESHLTLLSQIHNHPVLGGLNIFDDVRDYSAATDLSAFDLVVLPAFCGDERVHRHFDQHPSVISLDRLHRSHRRSFRNRWDGSYSHLLFYKHQFELNENLARQFGFDEPMPPLYAPRGKSDAAASGGRIGLYINTPINEFQALPNRQWPLAHWEELIRILGVESVLLIGGPTDRPNLEKLAERSRSAMLVTPSLGDFTAACKHLRAFVTTDGGLMHVAATTGVPIVSLHGASSAVLLHPWIYPEGKCISIQAPNTCSPCQRSFRLKLCEQGITQMVCMPHIEPGMVRTALSKLEALNSGTCLILKGNRFMSRATYVRSWKRKALSTTSYNFARIALKLGVTARRPELPPFTVES